MAETSFFKKLMISKHKRCKAVINKTSMFSDSKGQPYIVTYWSDPGTDLPQYHLIYKHGKSWKIYNTAFQHTAFSLRGMGTKHIPISRPQIISWNKKDKQCDAIIFRDEERGNKVSSAICDDLHKMDWKVVFLPTTKVRGSHPTILNYGRKNIYCTCLLKK